jgi:hypothetical protein
MQKSFPEYAGQQITMRYEEGGKTQVFKIGDQEYRVFGSASVDQAILLIRKEMETHNAK